MSLKEINKLRKTLGLPLIVEAIRKCGVCGKNFKSKSSSDRTCTRCKKIVSEYDDNEYEISDSLDINKLRGFHEFDY